MKIVAQLFIVGIAFGVIVGCSQPEIVVKNKKIAQHNVEITIKAQDNPKHLNRSINDAWNEFERRLKLVEGVGSETEKINNSRNTPVKVSPEYYDLLKRLIDLTKETRGFYDLRFGEVRELWAIGSDYPSPPDLDNLRAAITRSSKTEITLLDDYFVNIIGEGKIDLFRVGLAFAVDGAAEILQKNNVHNGKITASDIIRLWGTPDNEQKWNYQFYSLPLQDSIKFVVEPEAGGLSILDYNKVSFKVGSEVYHSILDYETGMPSRNAVSTAGWANDALTATVFAEAGFIMGRTIFESINNRIDIGLMILYEDKYEFGYLVESNDTMGEWISSEIP